MRKFQLFRSRKPPLMMQRPLGPDDFSPLELGWKIVKPHFVGVGVPKAGTSWWYSMMLNHQNIVPHRLYDPRVSVSKELHYFLHFGFRPPSGAEKKLYLESFAAPVGCITGEWSVSYLANLPSISALAATIPDTKALVMLRNPIDRLLSHVNHLSVNRRVVLGIRNHLTHFFKVFSIYPEVLFYSQYAAGLHHLLDCFPRENILVLQYEKCAAEPEGQYKRTIEFLGLEPASCYPNFTRRVNTQSRVELTSEVDRSYIARLFRRDVEITCELFPELDLNLWADFSTD